MNRSRYNYRRRATSDVAIATLHLGSEAPVRVQSMTNLSTNDIDGCVAQCKRIADAGGEIVRLTTQGVREAESVGIIRTHLRNESYNIPIVADVHFNPRAAMKAVETTDKVRINPGNFADAARTFRKLEYTDAEYAAEIVRIRTALTPFLKKCKEYGTTIRLGVNHGSLSDRIMSRYGDTPAGMVESVMEYLRICREQDFSNIVISIKASSTRMMVATVRLLVKAMDAEQMNFPLHLGVTEAGDGEDGRIKSAVGIGTLLAEGIGDTIRVSLSEAPEAEIPVARKLTKLYENRKNHSHIIEPAEESEVETRSVAEPINGLSVIAVAGHDFEITPKMHPVDASSEPKRFADSEPVILESHHRNYPGEIQSWIERFITLDGRNPIVIKKTFDSTTCSDDVLIEAAADLGTVLLNGHGSAIMIESPNLSAEEVTTLSLNILQATGLRISKTEFISCPGCGRTLFDLQAVVHEVKKTFSHLKGLKIAVMGCIVNGPGEMADADYGYVGAAAGRVSLYRGKECVDKNIPQEEAIDRLKAIIKADGIADEL